MKKLFFILATFLMFGFKGYGVLPPFAEDIREIQAILCDPQLYNSFASSEILQKIEKDESGFLLTASHHTMQVNVIYIPQDLIGPAQFRLEFQSPEERGILGIDLLPPLAQGVREIQTILCDPKFYPALGSAEILQKIEKNASGYLITTHRYTMQVDIVYFAPEFPDAPNYNLEFHEPEARDNVAIPLSN